MSLKTYVDTTVQDFKKIGAASILFSLQNAPTYKLLHIYDAYENGSSDAPTSITAVEVSKSYPFSETNRIVLPINLIIFDIPTNQYLVDKSKKITGLLNESIYYLEFKNGFNTFVTEAFLVKKMDTNISMDLTIITFDSNIITFDKKIINI